MRPATARLLAEFRAALHQGPGPHASGSPQSVHAGGANPAAKPRGPMAFRGQPAFDFEHPPADEPAPTPTQGIIPQPDPERVAEATRMAREALMFAAAEAHTNPRYVENTALAQVKEWCQQGTVTIRISAEGAKGVLESGRYKTGFETKPEHFDELERREFEQRGMGVPLNTPPERRPVYAVIPVNEDDGATWGDVQLRLKDSVKQRSTITLGDSIDGFALGTKVATPLNAPGVTALGTDTEMIFGAEAGELIPGRLGQFYSYIEAQVHGGVTLADIEEIVVPGKKGRTIYGDLLDLAQRKGIRTRIQEDRNATA